MLGTISAGARIPHHPSRAHPRFGFAEWIELSVGGSHFCGFAEDLSQHGVRLRDVFVAEGEEVTLYMVIPQHDGDRRVVTIEGTVCWTDSQRAGIRFRPCEMSEELIRSAILALSERGAGA